MERQVSPQEEFREGLKKLMHTPRERFIRATPEDKRKRSRLYSKGQIRLFFNGRKIVGPVKLLGVTYFFEAEEVEGGWWARKGGTVQNSERVWVCEFLTDNRVANIGEFSLGNQVTDMEAIAWAAK